MKFVREKDWLQIHKVVGFYTPWSCLLNLTIRRRWTTTSLDLSRSSKVLGAILKHFPPVAALPAQGTAGGIGNAPVTDRTSALWRDGFPSWR